MKKCCQISDYQLKIIEIRGHQKPIVLMTKNQKYIRISVNLTKKYREKSRKNKDIRKFTDHPPFPTHITVKRILVYTAFTTFTYKTPLPLLIKF